MPHQVLSEPIDVIIDFIKNKAIPRRIRWNNHTYSIKQVNLVHPTYEGQKKIFYFSVSDSTNFFKLKLDSETLEWRLVELYTDGI